MSELLLDKYLLYLRIERGHSKNTLESYKRDLSDYISYLTDRDIPVTKVSRSHIMDYLLMRRNTLSVSSVARLLAAIKSLYNYMIIDDLVSENPASDIDSPKLGQKLPAVLNQDEVDRLINAASRTKDRLLIELLYATGIRVSEAAGLKVEDCDLDEGWLRIYGKGGRERSVPVGKKLIRMIKKYLTEKNMTPGFFIFSKKDGRPMTREALWKIVKKSSRIAGLKKDIGPHTLRHTFATHMLENGSDLRIIQELLGHANIDTTQIYTHINRRNLKDIHRRYHPRG